MPDTAHDSANRNTGSSRVRHQKAEKEAQLKDNILPPAQLVNAAARQANLVVAC